MTTRIYTRNGDYGKTNLYDSKGLFKNNPIFDALGDLDELGAFIGLLISSLETNQTRGNDCDSWRHSNPNRQYIVNLRSIQETLLDIGSDLSTVKETGKKIMVYETVQNLEILTDGLNEQKEPLKQFILQGSSTPDALANVCRTITRRAERNMYKAGSFQGNEYSFSFINRLSSFFFALSRVLAPTEIPRRS